MASRSAELLHSLFDEITAFGGRAVVVPTDVTDRVQVQWLIKEALGPLGRIDILVCSAGVYPRIQVRDSTIEDYRRCMEVNFYGSVSVILSALPAMLNRRQGHIVVVSSVDGKKGLPMDAVYVSTKFALTGFADVLRQELRGTGVSVSTILPGRVDTPMIAHLTVPVISTKISPDRVARAVVKAIRRKRAEIVVPYQDKALILAGSISARLGDRLVQLFRLEGKDMEVQ
jgi:NADP-dependent 3-hydroxy acid dehydrogenase YdfG